MCTVATFEVMKSSIPLLEETAKMLISAKIYSTHM